MWLFKGGADAAPCDHTQDQLLTSLTTFIELHSCRQDYFRTTADAMARAQEQSEESQRQSTARAVLGGFCGAALGGPVGALVGCAAGSLGSVCAAAVRSNNLNPLSATAGFLGGVMGGAVGATFAGVLGGGIGAVSELAGYSIDGNLYELMWCAVGGATGAGIGHIFGGEVGLAGGAFGGCCGGLLGVQATFVLIKKGFGQSKETRQKANTEAKNDSVLQVFTRNASPLVAELVIVNKISSRMGEGGGAMGVAAQSSKCLAAVSRAEKALGRVQYDTQPSASCLGKAAQQCKQVTEEFEKMKHEGQKLLASWSK